jgi:hypothetical protein
LSITKARRFGWMGHTDPRDAFAKAFGKMKVSGQVPVWWRISPGPV